MKNIVFIPAIDAGRGRHYAYKYSIQSWKNWADNNNCDVIVWETPLYSWEEMTIPWQRYYLFDMLDNNNVEYDKVLMVDCDTIVHPDTPNFLILLLVTVLLRILVVGSGQLEAFDIIQTCLIILK